MERVKSKKITRVIINVKNLNSSMHDTYQENLIRAPSMNKNSDKSFSTSYDDFDFLDISKCTD